MSLAGPLAASAPPDDGVADAAVFGPPYAPRPAEDWALENCPWCGCGQLLAQSRKGGCWNCGLRACGLRAGQ